MKNISDIIGRDISCAIYRDNYLIKELIEKIYPEYDFSIYNTFIENNIELIDEWSLINELMKNDQYFRNEMILMLDDYKNFGFFGDEEFIHKIFELASGYEDNLEELIPIGNLEINNCFEYSSDIMNITSEARGRRQSKKQRERCKQFRNKNDKEKKIDIINNLNNKKKLF